MRENFIVDAHAHSGYPNIFSCPEVTPQDLLCRMDSLQIEYALHCGDMESIVGDSTSGLEKWEKTYKESRGRIPYLCVFDPRQGHQCLEVLGRAQSLDGFRGIKIHPTFHKTPPEDQSYEPAWRFAADTGLPIMSHTWSVSSYNPGQALSTPGRFEVWVRSFPSVSLVLGHSGGRGSGRHEAIRMVKQYENVYMDFAGDIYCYDYMHRVMHDVPIRKVLFGSDWPWIDPRSHLSRVFLSDLSLEAKRKVLRDNAMAVYHIG